MKLHRLPNLDNLCQQVRDNLRTRFINEATQHGRGIRYVDMEHTILNHRKLYEQKSGSA